MPKKWTRLLCVKNGVKNGENLEYFGQKNLKKSFHSNRSGGKRWNPFLFIPTSAEESLYSIIIHDMGRESFKGSLGFTRDEKEEM